MARVKCNSCGGTYDTVQRDGTSYAHVCDTEEIRTHAECDVDGNVVKAEVREPRESVRNENPRPGLHSGGKFYVTVPNPEERHGVLLVPGEPGILSEGKGVTTVE